MKVIKCTDEVYDQVAAHASERGITLTRAVGELVVGQVDMELPVDKVREVIKEELEVRLGKQLSGGVSKWLDGILTVQLNTDQNVINLCRLQNMEPTYVKPQS